MVCQGCSRGGRGAQHPGGDHGYGLSRPRKQPKAMLSQSQREGKVKVYPVGSFCRGGRGPPQQSDTGSMDGSMDPKPLQGNCRQVLIPDQVLGLWEICGMHRWRTTKDIMEAAKKASWWPWLSKGGMAECTTWTRVRRLLTSHQVAWVKVHD